MTFAVIFAADARAAAWGKAQF